MGATFPRVTLGRDPSNPAPLQAMTEGSPVQAPLTPVDPAGTAEQPVVPAPPTTAVEYTVDVATAPPPVVAQTAAYAVPSVAAGAPVTTAVASAGPVRGLPTTGVDHEVTLSGATEVLVVGLLAIRVARRRRPVPVRVRA
jgi:hypothetical protein